MTTLAPFSYPAAPRWAWDILDDTLALDAESGAFDMAVRADIARALDAVKTVIFADAAPDVLPSPGTVTLPEVKS